MVPPSSEADRAGMQHRVGVFIQALGQRFARIDMVFMVHPTIHARCAALPPGQLDLRQSEFWDTEVHATTLPRRIRTETYWSHYGIGILDGLQQPLLHAYGGAPLTQAVAAHLDSSPDIVFVDRLEAMLPVLQSRRRPPHVLLDLNDVDHKMRLRAAGLTPRQVALLFQIPALIFTERRAVGRARITTVCSETDRAHLRRIRFPDTVRVVPNALPIPAEPPGLGATTSLLFLGAADYDPNRDAALRLATRIWPLIHAAMPTARLILAGRGMESLLSQAHPGRDFPGIDARGFIPDLAALYAETRIVCCPLTQGSGTRLKLVEAAAYARPIVSTRIGAEGLDLAPDHAILLRETDTDIAAACLTLLNDSPACLRLGQAARAAMTRMYDRAEVLKAVHTLIDQVAA